MKKLKFRKHIGYPSFASSDVGDPLRILAENVSSAMNDDTPFVLSGTRLPDVKKTVLPGGTTYYPPSRRRPPLPTMNAKYLHARRSEALLNTRWYARLWLSVTRYISK